MRITATNVLDVFHPDAIVKKILHTRGITDVESFLHPASPVQLTLAQFGYEEAWKRIIPILEELRRSRKTVVVYTDYDADGITGGTVLWETLHLLGFTVMPYVPHRAREGYGFSRIGIDTIKQQFDPALVISVDHGITAVEQIAYAESIGIPVIVTDHHHKQENIPDRALGIFHIPQLSGSGTAYVFAKQIYEHFRDQFTAFGIDQKNIDLLERYFETEYASIASIGTIADLVPLVGPSRQLVAHGLRQFHHIRRPGIAALLQQSGLAGKEIGTYEVGFMIAPRINAVGRLEHAIDALRLLCTTNVQKAQRLAGHIGDLNTGRQELVKKAVVDAIEQVESLRDRQGQLPKILMVSSRDWQEGIIGLIASALVEEYYRPAIVMTETDELFKASARSIHSFHVTQYFEQMKELFSNFGGHKQAAGFSLPKKNIDLLKEQGVELASKLISDSDLIRTLEVDMEAPVGRMSMEIARAFEALRPFGVGNPAVRFVSDVELVDARVMGKTGDHLKMMVRDRDYSSFPLELVGFKQGKLCSTLSKGQALRVGYQLDINRWNGKETLQGKLLGVEKPS